MWRRRRRWWPWRAPADRCSRRRGRIRWVRRSRLDYSRLVVIVVVADLLDVAAWLEVVCTGKDVDGGRP